MLCYRPTMETRRLRAGIVLVLAVVSLGAAGAAIDSDGSGGGSFGVGEGSGTGLGQGESGIMVDPELHPFFDAGILGTILGALTIAGILVVIVAAVQALLHWDWADFREFLHRAGSKLAIAGVLVLLLYLLIQNFPDLSGGGSTGALGEGAAEGAGSATSSTGLDLPLLVGAVVLVVVLVIVAVVVGRREDDEEGPESAAPVATDEGRVDPVGTGGGSMGRTAIGSVPADNDVYRTWLALVDAANADVRRDSPAEVADRAVDAGVDEGAVREITSLFESVRYGSRATTESTERRARSARERLANDR